MSIFIDNYIILNIVLLSNNVEIFKLLVSTFKDFYKEVYNNNFDDDAFFKLIFDKYNIKSIDKLSRTKCAKAIKCIYAYRQTNKKWRFCSTCRDGLVDKEYCDYCDIMNSFIYSRTVNYCIYIDQTVGCGNLNLIKWLNNNLKLDFNPIAMANAAEYGYLDIMEYFRNTGMQCSSLAPKLAAENGDLEIVKWIYKHYRQLFKEARYQYNDNAIGAMLSSIKGDKLEVFLWFYKNFNQCKRITILQIAELAVNSNSITILVWCFNSQIMNCGRCKQLFIRSITESSFDAMIWIIKRMNKQNLSDEFLFADAMYHAAKNNNLRAIKWLHEEQHQHCDSNSLCVAESLKDSIYCYSFAAEHNHNNHSDKQVIAYLKEHQSPCKACCGQLERRFIML